MFNLTKNQIKLLNIFLNRHRPERPYYFRELGKIIGKEPGVFQKDLNNLVEKGILSSYYQANSRFFELDKKYPLYEELKRIFMKTVGAAGLLKEKLSQIEHIETAFIFGSFAKGKEDQFSDIDLMIIGHPDEDKLVMSVSDIEIKISREINYNIFSAGDFRKGLKKREVFLEQIMAEPKIFITGDETKLEKIAGKRPTATEKSQPKRS